MARKLGTAGNDVLTGSSAADTLLGLAGNDRLRGLAGKDVLDGGAGNDTLDGGTGDDTLSGGTGNDTLSGGPGHDRLRGDDGPDILHGDAGDDRLDGGSGNDRLAGGTGKDMVLGGIGNDRLDGGSDDDRLEGGVGNDVLLGGTGNDTLRGDRGNDFLDGGAGRDTLLGAGGNDTLTYDRDDASQNGGSGSDTLRVSGGGTFLGAASLANFAAFEVLDLRGSGANQLTLDQRLTERLSDTDTLRVLVGSDDSVTLNGGWLTGATRNGVTTYTLNDATAQVDASAEVVVNGVINLASLDGHKGARFDGVAGDLSGSGLAKVGDLNADGLDDFALGATGNGAGAVYVVFGTASALATSINLGSLSGTNGLRIAGVASLDLTGAAISAAGDINGDGIDDMLIGAPGAAGGTLAGASYVIFGSDDPFNTSLSLSDLAASDGFRLDGPASNDHSGVAIGGAGDVNGDGFADFIIGASAAQPNGAGSGTSYVVFGHAGSFGTSLDLASLDGNLGFRLDGAGAGHNAGLATAAGDLNGDGYGDLIVAAPGAAPNGSSSGSSYVVFGHAGTFASAVALGGLNGQNGFRLDGVAASDHSGFSLGSAGDFNGDGIDDLIVGAQGADPHGDYSGSSYLVFGASTGFGTALALSSLDGTNGFRIDGAAAGERAGGAVRGAGDLNGDGYDDVVIGAYHASPNGEQSGSSYVLFGAASGFAAVIELSGIDGGNGLRLDGVAAGDSSGQSVSAAGDVNGDGFGDLLIGANLAGPNDSNAGASYLIFGADFNGVVALHGGSADDTLSGTAVDENIVAGRGDDTLTGGGGSDVLLGGAGDDILDYDSIDRRIDGGNGDDSLRITHSGAAFSGSRHLVRNVEQLDLRGGVASTVSLDGLGVLGLGSARHALRLLGDTNDTVNLTGAWTAHGEVTPGYTRYVVDPLTAAIGIDVANGVEVVVAGVIGLSGLDGSNGYRLDGTATGNRTGASVSGAGDVNGDGYADFLIGAFRTNLPVSDAGSTYLMFGSAENAVTHINLGTLDGQHGARFDGVAIKDYAGYSVGLLDDVNGDGLDDLVIGAPTKGNLPATSAGASYVVFGNHDGFAPSVGLGGMDGSDGFRLSGSASGDQSGYAVSALGDFDGDGFGDLIVTAPFATPHAVASAGSAYIIFGRDQDHPFAANLSLAALHANEGRQIDGADANQILRGSRGGDLNGDGFDDLLIGGRDAAVGSDAAAGMAFVIFGTATRAADAIALDTLDGTSGLRVLGRAAGDHLGSSVQGAGDLNGDGFDDFVIGAAGAAPNGAGSGSSYVVFGKPSFSSEFDLTTLNGSSGFRIDGAATDDASGSSVAAAGDVNGDGYGDLLIGAPAAGDGGSGAGATYLLFGAASGFQAVLTLASLDAKHGLRFDGSFGDGAGYASAAGDVNGDGFDDILIGAPDNGPGHAYLIYGRDFNGQVDRQGGDGNDSLSGSSADEHLIGGRGNDILDGAGGADVLRGGAGDDVLVWRGDLRHGDGGGGVDTLRVDGSAVTLDFSALARHVIEHIERIDLGGSGNNTLTLNLHDVLAVSDHGALRIDGNAGDSISSIGQGWAQDSGAAQRIGGQLYVGYTLHGAHLLIDSDITRTVS